MSDQIPKAVLPNHSCNPSLLVPFIVGRAYKMHGPQRIRYLRGCTTVRYVCWAFCRLCW